jgi:hypothetical protein
MAIGARGHSGGELPATGAVAHIDRVGPAILHDRGGKVTAHRVHQGYARRPVGIVVQREWHRLELPVDRAGIAVGTQHAQAAVGNRFRNHAVGGVAGREQNVVMIRGGRVPDAATAVRGGDEGELRHDVASVGIDSDQLAILDRIITGVVDADVDAVAMH